MQRNWSTQDINDSLLNGVKIEMVSAYTMEWMMTHSALAHEIA